MAQEGIWGWDETNKTWVKVLVNAAGKLIIDPSEIFEDTPTDGEMGKAPTSNWAHDEAVTRSGNDTSEVTARNAAIATHAALPSVHHSRYTDAEAIAAAKTDPTLLNYTQGARVYNSANQTIANTAWTLLAFDSERYDTDAIHNPTTNNSRLTCKTAGKYIISGQATFYSNTIGLRYVDIFLNGAKILGRFCQAALNGDTSPVETTTVWELAVNDYVELRVYQNSGGNLAVISFASLSPEFMMQRIG